MSDDAVWLSRPERYNWLHLGTVLTALPQAIEAQLKRDAGLNYFEYSVLAGLSESPRRAMKMSDLASFSHGSPSRLSHAVSRLERAGWVERCTLGTRGVEAVLTDAGLAKIVEAAPGHVAEVRRLVVDALTVEEFDQLQHAVRKILLVAAPHVLQVLDETFIAEGEKGAGDDLAEQRPAPPDLAAEPPASL